MVVDTIPSVGFNFKFREEITLVALILWVGVSYMIPKSIYYFVCLFSFDTIYSYDNKTNTGSPGSGEVFSFRKSIGHVAGSHC